MFVLAATLVFGCGQGATSSDAGGDTSHSAGHHTPPPGTENAEVLIGTPGDDVIRARGGEDVVRGMGGNDEIHGGEGKDRLYGGPGDDVVDAQDRGSRGAAGRDEISCGPGRDEVLMDAEDEEKPRDCEMSGVGTS